MCIRDRLAVVAFTLLASIFLLLPGELSELGRATQRVAYFFSNHLFWNTQNDYWQQNSLSNQPLLHTWSLAVSYTHLDVYKRQPITLWRAFCGFILVQHEVESPLCCYCHFLVVSACINMEQTKREKKGAERVSFSRGGL